MMADQLRQQPPAADGDSGDGGSNAANNAGVAGVHAGASSAYDDLTLRLLAAMDDGDERSRWH
jgi:hypothetical protein